MRDIEHPHGPMAAENGVTLLASQRTWRITVAVGAGCWEEERPSPQFQGKHGPDDNFLGLFYYMYVYEFIILCGYACCMYTCVSVLGDQKRVLDPWELELQSCEPLEVMVNQTAAH